MINFYHAEVTKLSKSKDTYKWNNDELFTIDALYDDDGSILKIKDILPLNNNVKQIPIIGETVLIFQADSKFSAGDFTGRQWFYTNSINMQSKLSNHQSPIITNGEKKDENFEKVVNNKSIFSLQPYLGDMLIEGRWGNSIRFGSTIKTTEDYSKKPTWTGNTAGDPILILSNGQTHDEEFTIENVKDDPASLYLTSTQKISNLDLKLKVFTEFDKKETTSQFIAAADRIVLNSKKDLIVLNSAKAVVINTDVLCIGDDEADQSMVFGEELEKILKELIGIIRYGAVGGGLASIFDIAALSNLETKIKNIKSNKFKIKK